jgi:cyclohexa-1,5-dienecarbonyl-CoA hydratase
MGKHQFLRMCVTDGIPVITLARPPLNVLHTPMLAELNTAVESALANGPAAIVFRGEGKAFCAGVDVLDHTKDRVRGMIESFHGIFRRLAASDAVTVAAVGGAALGGGCELATFCDIVLASERARFGQPEIKLGVFPPVAACILPWRVGVARAIELNALGEVVDAKEALRIGLADHVYSAEEFEASVDGFVAGIAKLSRPAVRLAKGATSAPARRQFLAQLEEAERLYLEELMKLHDAHEGLAAFMEKREPQWAHA